MASANRWNVYSTIYNPFLYFADTMRRQQFELLDQAKIWQLTPMNVYLAGAGTGLDLPYLVQRLAKNSKITCVDFSAKMLEKAEKLGKKYTNQVQTEFKVTRAELSGLADNSCDLAIIHLVLAVTDQPDLLLQEAIRVLKPNGIISLWDKFLPDDQQPSLLRKICNQITLALGTSINLQLSKLIQPYPLKIQTRTYCHAGLMQQVILQKIANSSEL